MLPAFLRRRLDGEVPFARLFWWDMLFVATMINLAMGGIALAAHMNGAPIWLSAVLFFSPLPYNLTLCLSVWRSLARQPSAWSGLAKCATVIWLALMLFV